MATVLAVTVACTSGGKETVGTADARAAQAGSDLSLKDVCPATVVAQTNWYPQVEHAVFYQLLGDGYTVDRARKRVTGPLVAGGVDTGVKLEIRVGGPALGYQSVAAVMYTDPSITMGLAATDDTVQHSKRQPLTAVMAQLDVDPIVIMWDPKNRPNINTIADIGQTPDMKVLYYEGESTFVDYLISSGILRTSQLEGGYDGSPARFVAANGAIAVQGFATNEPYVYQHETRGFNRPVRWQLVSDAGYPGYRNAVVIRTGDKARLAPCLNKLVPILQQAEVDFIRKPDRVIDLTVGMNRRYNSGFFYDTSLARYAVGQMRDIPLVGNGSNKTLGDFDLNRVRRIITIVTPIYIAKREDVRTDLTPDDLATNEFVNPAVGLPS